MWAFVNKAMNIQIPLSEGFYCLRNKLFVYQVFLCSMELIFSQSVIVK